MSIKDFYCVFVRTEMNLIVFSGPRNCVNTQYAALSGAMLYEHQQETKVPFLAIFSTFSRKLSEINVKR